MALDLKDLAKKMFEAAFSILETDAPAIKSFAEVEFKKIAATIVMIENEHVSGSITSEEAKLLVDMQKSASRSVLLTSSGLTLLTVEKSINAALGQVRSVVNGALGFVLV